MRVDKTYYTGEVDITTDIGALNTVKRCSPFSSLSSVEQNEKMNDSIFQNSCRNDMLNRRIWMWYNSYDGQSFSNLELHYTNFVPEVTNYFPVYDMTGTILDIGRGQLTSLAQDTGTWGYKLGDSTGNLTAPRYAPITEMATKYAVLCIYVSYLSYTDTGNTTADGTPIIQADVNNVTQISYDALKTILTLDPNWFDTHMVVEMWAELYYGTGQNRQKLNNVGLSHYDGIDKVMFEDITSNCSGFRYSETLSNSVAASRTLVQGGYNILIGSDSTIFPNSVYAFTGNISYWRPHIRYLSSPTVVRIIFGITDELALQSAFNAYRATGFFFTGGPNIAASYDLDQDDLDPDVISRGNTDENGKTDGEDGTTDSTGLVDDPSNYGDNGYSGEENIDPNKYSIDTPLTAPSLTTINVFNRAYAMNITQLTGLVEWLWNADDDKFAEIVDGLRLMGENPMNGLIDCRLYPFAITDMIGHAGGELITIGRTRSEVYGVKLENSANCIIDLGECTFFKKHKDFLDYSPHTQARLYIPYCGWHQVDPAEFMGKTITCKLIVDVITGACNCIVYADGIILINATGSIGVEIPMTGTDSATYASQTLNAGMQAISQIAQAGVSIAAGAGSLQAGSGLATASDISKTTQGLHQVQSGQMSSGGIAMSAWNAHTVPVQYEMAGTATPACANWLPQYAYFVIDRPVTIIPDNYGHTIGFACCESGQLSGYSGFTICTNVDTSGFAQATEAERAELKALLEAGVYL